MRYLTIYIFFLLILASSCNKLMNVPPNSGQQRFTTLDNCQAALNNDGVMNGFGIYGYPSMPIISADEYYVSPGQFDSCSTLNQQAMTWSPSLTTGDAFPDWSLPYSTIASTNDILVSLPSIPRDGQAARWQTIYCSAHFFRAFAFYQLAQVFAPPYDSSTAKNTPGIPLPMSPDRGQKVFRASLQATYDQIFSDLREAENTLPDNASGMPTKPSKAAVYAMFARGYLCTHNYSAALLYADSCLHLQSALMQYDTIPTTRYFDFHRWNPEVIFSAAYYRIAPAGIYRSHVDSSIIASYREGDLRKTHFFKLGDYFFGTYDEEGYCFAGISTDEVYLIRSECQARLNNIPAAMAGLNYLLRTRWVDSTFIPYAAMDKDDALDQILSERKKELLWRGTRWTDLRRLNKETLSRTVHGHTYILPPNDPRWTLPIPDDVLEFNPGMPQNAR